MDRSPEDLREVGNYVVALEHGISRLKKPPRYVRLTRELHDKLMTDVQGGPSSARTFSQDSELDWQAWQHDRNCFVHPATAGSGRAVSRGGGKVPA